MRYRPLALLIVGALAPLAGSATTTVTIDWAAVGDANNTADAPSSNCNATFCAINSVAGNASGSRHCHFRH